MPEQSLQEQVEHLASMGEIFYETPERQEGFKEDIYALIRDAVEECCGVVNDWLPPQNAITPRIRRHFIWLEKK